LKKQGVLFNIRASDRTVKFFYVGSENEFLVFEKCVLTILNGRVGWEHKGD